MVDSISVLDRVHELQVLVANLRYLKIIILGSVQGSKKLTLVWHDYKEKHFHTAENFLWSKSQSIYELKRKLELVKINFPTNARN